MDDARLRSLGLIGGGGALLIALGIATFGEDRHGAAPKADPPPASVAAQPSAGAVASIPGPTVETAMAEGPTSRPVSIPQDQKKEVAKDDPVVNPDLEFIVRFDDRHPLSRAQALYLQGKRDDAEASARETLARRKDLQGLCFERFTYGAEIVLSNCERVPRAQLDTVSARWVRKLRAMRGVQYVDANVVMRPEAK